MRVHELIGLGIKQARESKGWTQERAAKEYRANGLAWRTGAAGQVETGVRRPGIGELLLICAALDVTLEKLVPDSDAPIEMHGHAVMPANAVRAALARKSPSGTVRAPQRLDVPADTESHAARKLGMTTAEVKAVAQKLWGRDFAAERDRRLGDVTGMPARTLQAHRGHATKAMLAEIVAEWRDAYREKAMTSE